MGKFITDLSSVTTVGLDLAKHVFRVHGVDASGRVVVAKAIRRNKLLEFFASLPACLVGLEASGSAHHWARELITLGHDARMMPPVYVKPYVRRQKNDASDAAAICEAVTRPSMRFVGVRSLENQAALMRHKAREMLVSQRTQLLNGLRGHLTEIGMIAAQGPRHARELAELIEACDETIPFEVCEALAPLVVQLRNLDEAIERLERTIAKLAQKDETARRLMSIPGFGPITALAMAATIQDTSSFAGPRELLGKGDHNRVALGEALAAAALASDRLLALPGSLELSDQCRLLELGDAAKDLTHQDRRQPALGKPRPFVTQKASAVDISPSSLGGPAPRAAARASPLLRRRERIQARLDAGS